MKFVNHSDVQRPMDAVFDYISQFEALEARAKSAGLKVRRVSGDAALAVGTQWQVEGRFAGAERKVDIRLEQVKAPNSLVFKNVTGGIEVDFEVQVLPQAANRTRLRTITNMKARSLSARLILQSMRLIRPRINGRIDRALAKLAARIEAET